MLRSLLPGGCELLSGNCGGRIGPKRRLLGRCRCFRCWRRLDVNQDMLDGKRGGFQMVGYLVRDFVAAADGQIAVHLDVEFHEDAESALASAAFLDAQDARH